jgi:hypothetical protein
MSTEKKYRNEILNQKTSLPDFKTKKYLYEILNQKNVIWSCSLFWLKESEKRSLGSNKKNCNKKKLLIGSPNQMEGGKQT